MLNPRQATLGVTLLALSALLTSLAADEPREKEKKPPPLSRVVPAGRGVRVTVVAEQLSGPVNDILWYKGRLYISHRGKISMLEGPGQVRDLVTGLPSLGDHHNN